jgi:hypothetical protein
MTQHSFVIDDAPGATVLADMNTAFQALASTNKGDSEPDTLYEGEKWIDETSPSSSIWTEYLYDGADHIPVALIDTTNNRRLPAIPITPGGRLTLTSATPVLSADVSGATTVYYTPYLSDLIPLYTEFFAPYVFTELSLALDSNSGHTGYQQSGKNFDLFVFNDSGTLRLGTGPAWSSDTARGTGAGTTELERKNGIWTNKVSATMRFGSSAGNTVSVAANQATYVGTMRATANGQTSMVFKPSATAGGNANVLGLYNAYHRVRVQAMSRDSTSNWTYATTTWRSADNNANNRISFVDGLQSSAIDAMYQVGVDVTGSGAGLIGVNLDSTSATPGVVGQSNTSTTTNTIARESFVPQLGFHFVQAMEYSAGATTTFRGVLVAQQQALTVSLEM